jgi:hypothetical protein
LVAEDGFQGVNELVGFAELATPFHHNGRHTRESGYPVRRGFSAQSQPPLEYWIIRIRG